MSIRRRIIQIMPLACPLWGVFAMDRPDVIGHHFYFKQMHGLALVEIFESPGPFDGPEPDTDRDREIHPIYVEDESCFDTPDAYETNDQRFTIMDTPYKELSESDRTAVENAALEHLQHLKRMDEARALRAAQKK
jgi:hypothetical protein